MRKAGMSLGAMPDKAPEAEPPAAAGRLKAVREFALKPRDLFNHFGRFVIGQEEAKRVLSVAICDHYNHVRRCIENPRLAEEEYAKHNIILLGPSGVGKTYLMRCAARLIGVPLVKADATKFSETGYVGHDVEDLVRDLVKAADGDVDLAQYGIIYLDEIDKIAGQATGGGRDVSGRGVQVNLLKLMEETDVSLFSQTDLLGQVQAVMDLQRGKGPGRRTISTRHVLFIVSGAFDGLSEEVRRRLRAGRIGFAAAAGGEGDNTALLRLAETQDFVKFGFETEFIGRLPIRVVCEPLSADDLEEIMLHSEGSILKQYRDDFEGYGIGFRVAGEAVKAVAAAAYRENTGARGLMTVLERVFRGHKFELPSTPVRAFEVTAEMVADPGKALRGLVDSGTARMEERLRDDVRAYAERFRRQHGLSLAFRSDAVEAVVALCLAERKSVDEICAARFHDFEYGLKLIARNTGRTSFAVTRRLVEHPSEELSRRIARSFARAG
ncbi:MAG: AAA family ATPase [Lentisphaerae bacterium]|nr:AAA family ATPase [Lentisphaerota bacterium]